MKTTASKEAVMHRNAEVGVGRASVVIVLLIALAPMLAGCAGDTTSSERRFESPEEAVEVLLQTVRANDTDGLAEIFGSEYPEIYATSDPVADAEARRTFLAKAGEGLTFEALGPDTTQIVLGNQEWPFPVPLARDDAGWRFDSATGFDEILNRRVGRNETAAIEMCDALVFAQDYFRVNDLDGDELADYADRFNATPGQHDGLYWPAGEDEPLSPLNDFVTSEQDYLSPSEPGSPLGGYFARLLTKQGPSAPGGAMSFTRDDQLVDGFAMVLWPAEYGRSGVMTFIISHHGTVYERDLGDDSAEIAATIDTFDPDEAWSAIE